MYGYAAIDENEAYDTNYGATIYKFYGGMGHLRSVVYDFDTEGLPHWYIDDAKYYYRTDGTTLVPDNFVSITVSGTMFTRNTMTTAQSILSGRTRTAHVTWSK